MKKLTAGLLSVSLMLIVASSAMASPSNVTSGVAAVPNKEVVITPQAYDGVGFNIDTPKVAGGSVGIRVESSGGNGVFTGEATFDEPDGKTTVKYSSSRGQGSSMSFDNYYTKPGRYEVTVVVRSAGYSESKTVSFTITKR